MHGWCICKAQTPMTQHVTKEEILELFSREISPEMITLLDTKLSQLKLGGSRNLGRRLADTDRPGTAGKTEKGSTDEDVDDGGSDDSQVYGNYRNPFEAASEEDGSESDTDVKIKVRGRGR